MKHNSFNDLSHFFNLFKISFLHILKIEVRFFDDFFEKSIGNEFAY